MREQVLDNAVAVVNKPAIDDHDRLLVPETKEIAKAKCNRISAFFAALLADCDKIDLVAHDFSA